MVSCTVNIPLQGSRGHRVNLNLDEYGFVLGGDKDEFKLEFYTETKGKRYLFKGGNWDIPEKLYKKRHKKLKKYKKSKHMYSNNV